MKITRRTNILVKTKRMFEIHRQNSPDEVTLCPQCGEEMSDAQTAADILGTSVREIYRLVEAGKIHFYENAERIGFLCPKSVCEEPIANKSLTGGS